MPANIIIMGANGRMGKTIREVVLRDGECHLAGLVDHVDCLDGLSAFHCPVSSSLEEILKDVSGAIVIDFTAPQVSLRSAQLVQQYGGGIVIGTTGLDASQMGELQKIAEKIPVFWSSNMSIGINALLKVLPMLSQTLGSSYDIEMVELHHRHKKDSPSGTALTLGECLAKSRDLNLPDVRCSSRDGIIGERPENQIGIQAIRGGDVVGVHTVYFMGEGERIEVTHQAHSRETFAQGAVRAAKWLATRKAGRIYGMQDML